MSVPLKQNLIYSEFCLNPSLSLSHYLPITRWLPISLRINRQTATTTTTTSDEEVFCNLCIVYFFIYCFLVLSFESPLEWYNCTLCIVLTSVVGNTLDNRSVISVSSWSSLYWSTHPGSLSCNNIMHGTRILVPVYHSHRSRPEDLPLYGYMTSPPVDIQIRHYPNKFTPSLTNHTITLHYTVYVLY